MYKTVVGKLQFSVTKMYETLTLLLICLGHVIAAQQHDYKRIIVDVDMGMDDYQGIGILLQAENQGKLKIEAIMCSKGNTALKDVKNNVLRLLETAGRTDIPVYAGSEEQILPRPELSPYFGEDGFGDLNLTEPDGNLIHRTISPTFIHDLLKAYPKEFTLIALAPTTNIALALREFADVAGNFKDIFIMGGNFNSTFTEFNFKSDPEAAAIVLATADVPITILTWEGCMSLTSTFDWLFNITNISNPVWNLIDKAEREVFSSEPSDTQWAPCDAILCASVAYPELILKQSVHNASVDLTTNRALVMIDSQATNDNDVVFIEIVDTDRFKQVFVESFSNICNLSGSVCLPKYTK